MNNAPKPSRRDASGWLEGTGTYHADCVDRYIEAERASHTAEVEALKGAMRADEGRLEQAAARVGLQFGCDTPDHMVQEILSLRAQLAAKDAEADTREREAFYAAFSANKRDDSYEFGTAEGEFAEYITREQHVAFTVYKSLKP